MENLDVLDLLIEFGGGAELLFGNVKKHKVQLQQDESSKWTIRKLLPWIQKNLLKERPELFLQDDSVRPGILVLVNDADWELLLFGLASCSRVPYNVQKQLRAITYKLSNLHGKLSYSTKLVIQIVELKEAIENTFKRLCEV